MRGNEKNAPLDRQKRSFSLEEAFLTRKNYKVIFCITLTLAALRTGLFVPALLGWKLTEGDADVMAFLFFFMLLILDFTFILIPIAFVVRIIFTHLLKKKIEQLEQAMGQPIAAPYQQNKL
ncbi:hypothetical protein [Bartonella massiliensis]|uniref:hypothetical protein n=1 Tax=Bartonella massiliensis TaxID=929795 RepID=UPI001159153C|nr:hypothetical protein [Bartonella massiliensis]